MKKLHEMHNRKNQYPNRIVQFGEGNFLRGFVDWQIDILNEKYGFDSGIVLVRPINSDMPPSLNTQNGLYTSIIRGLNENGDLIKEYRVIESVNEEIAIYKDFDRYLKLAIEPSIRFIFSNTTEAGIVFDEKDKFEDRPQSTFPGKLTRFLFERYQAFRGAKEKGLVIIPCELIDYNGEKLKEIVFKYVDLWNLEESFKIWLEESNTWCSTLVDRIVTGFPWDEREELEKELGYSDNFMVTAEYFYLFVIQGPKWLEDEFKLKESKLNIKIVEDIKPYKMRKVAILNGGHTAIVPVSYLYGNNIVLETMDTTILEKYLKDLIDEEIIPTLDMEKSELEDFADSVLNRFRNPYIKHQLTSISLNSMFKYKTRILPQFLKYIEINNRLPKKMVFSLASLIVFYRGKRGEENIPLNDDQKFIDLYNNLWEQYDGTLESATNIGREILSLNEHWEENLMEIDGLEELLGNYIYSIDKRGIENSLEEVL